MIHSRRAFLGGILALPLFRWCPDARVAAPVIAPDKFGILLSKLRTAWNATPNAYGIIAGQKLYDYYESWLPREQRFVDQYGRLLFKGGPIVLDRVRAPWSFMIVSSDLCIRRWGSIPG